MGDLLTSVPLRPGMEQRGAPVVDPITGERGLYDPAGSRVWWLYAGSYTVTGAAVEGLHLDLTEPLGRAVGWGWIVTREDRITAGNIAASGLSVPDVQRLLRAARDWRPMTAADVDRFARLILAVQP